jgi:hypothetical protein
MDTKPKIGNRSPTTLISGFECLLASLLLPFFGWLAEANHWVPTTDILVVFGLIASAAACGVAGIVLISNALPMRKTYTPGIACILASGFLLFIARIAEIRHWVTLAGVSDFWLALGVIVNAPAYAMLGLILMRKGPTGAWKGIFTGLAAIWVTLVSGYCVLGLFGVLP